MPRWLRIGFIVSFGLLIAAYGAWRYLTAREAVPETSSYVLDLAEVRRLAAMPTGPRPLRVETELVATAALPRAAVFAGESFDPFVMVHPVWRVVYADGFGMIDSAFDQAAHAEMGEGEYHAEAFAKAQRALGGARWIVITHEHTDHLQGIVAYPRPEGLLGRLMLTREQLASTRWLDAADFPQVLRDGLEPLVFDAYRAIAPGVVLIRAAGHTPGHQMVFVSLADGQELIFLGDTAWHMDQLRNLHYRPRLVTDYFLNEDRDAVLNQFRTLHDLMEAEPSVTLIASHDGDQRAHLLRTGVIVDGFGPLSR